jgi:hypothetical protein
MTQISDEKIDQLECCLQAATGVAAKTNPDGDVIGWSPAYQRTVELRAERDLYASVIDDISTAIDQYRPKPETDFSRFVESAIAHAISPLSARRPMLVSDVPMGSSDRPDRRVGKGDPYAPMYELRAERDRMAVQLAGCCRAAEGDETPAPEGSYGWSPAYQRTVELRAELVETRALAAFYRSCALSGEDPGEADEALAKVRAVLREAADKRQGNIPLEG